jgi:hypothetical protein
MNSASQVARITGVGHCHSTKTQRLLPYRIRLSPTHTLLITLGLLWLSPQLISLKPRWLWSFHTLYTLPAQGFASTVPSTCNVLPGIHKSCSLTSFIFVVRLPWPSYFNLYSLHTLLWFSLFPLSVLFWSVFITIWCDVSFTYAFIISLSLISPSPHSTKLSSVNKTLFNSVHPQDVGLCLTLT